MARSKWEWTTQRRIRARLRGAISHLPALYLPLVRLRRRPFMVLNGAKMIHTGVVSRETDIVIEGPRRCSNTFAVVAFQLAQERLLNVAHHLHAEAQIIRGAQLGIPVVLLVRDPEEVVVSTSSSFGVPIREALKDYVEFYSRVMPYRDRIVVADFEQVTTDLGGVVDAVNAKYGTRFKPFVHTQENVDRCFGVIDEFYKRTAPEPRRTVARPSEERSVSKEAFRAQYHEPQNAQLRQTAQRLYDTMVQREIAAS